jgi:hypothetical protein
LCNTHTRTHKDAKSDDDNDDDDDDDTRQVPWTQRLPNVLLEKLLPVCEQHDLLGVTDVNGWSTTARFNGVRFIEGDRIECDLARDFAKTCCVEAEAKVAEIMLFCLEQALADPLATDDMVTPEMRDGTTPVYMSFIVSFGLCDSQQGHIDVIGLGTVQFGVAITDDISPTVWLDSGNTTDSCVALSSGVWKDAPASVHAILQDAKTNEPLDALLRDQGALLAPTMQKALATRQEHTLNLRAGQVAAVAGGIVHAAPKPKKSRVVLFFSSSKPGATEYNPNDQFFPQTVICEVIKHCWDNVDEAGKQFMLRQLVGAVCAHGKAGRRLDHISIHLQDFQTQVERCCIIPQTSTTFQTDWLPLPKHRKRKQPDKEQRQDQEGHAKKLEDFIMDVSKRLEVGHDHTHILKLA